MEPEILWSIGAGLYGMVWLVVAHWLFNHHKAPAYHWKDQSFRFQLAFLYGLLALFWPLGGIYLIIRGKAAEDE